MKQALINPMQIAVTYISGWTDIPDPNPENIRAEPIEIEIENAYNIAQVENQSFEVAEPLFWVDCPDEVVTGLWYYSINTLICLKKNEAPNPNPPLPSS